MAKRLLKRWINHPIRNRIKVENRLDAISWLIEFDVFETLLDEFKGVTKCKVTPSQPGEIITNLT